MQPTADAALLEVAEAYEPQNVFTDPVLRALVHIAQSFDAKDEPGSAEVALGTARMMIARTTPAAYGRFAGRGACGRVRLCGAAGVRGSGS
jgi:hypothetical protein